MRLVLENLDLGADAAEIILELAQHFLHALVNVCACIRSVHVCMCVYGVPFVSILGY